MFVQDSRLVFAIVIHAQDSSAPVAPRNDEVHAIVHTSLQLTINGARWMVRGGTLAGCSRTSARVNSNGASKNLEAASKSSLSDDTVALVVTVGAESMCVSVGENCLLCTAACKGTRAAVVCWRPFSPC